MGGKGQVFGLLAPFVTLDREHIGLKCVDQSGRKRAVLLGIRQRGRVGPDLLPELDPDPKLGHPDLQALHFVDVGDLALSKNVSEADLAVVDKLDTRLGARDARDLGADLALQSAIYMCLTRENEPQGATVCGDLRRNGFLGIGPAGRDLDGAKPVLLDVLCIAAELTCREMLRLDSAAALFVEQLRPFLEGISQRRTDRLGMADAAGHLLLRASDMRASDSEPYRCCAGHCFKEVAAAP